MNSAGLNAVRLAQLLRKAADTIVAALEADKGVYNKAGELVAREPDWSARIKASQQVLDLAGVIPSRNAPPPEEKPPKEEPIPEWARPLVAKTIEVKQVK